MKQIRMRLTYANVMSSLAVFLVLGGATAFAASQLGKNSVGTNQLKKNSVTAAKIKKEAVTEAKIQNGAVTAGKIGAGAVGTTQLGKAAVTGEKLAANAVGTGNLTNNSVTSGKIAEKAVTTTKLNDKAVTTAKIGDKAVGFGQMDLTFVSNSVNVAATEQKSVTAVCPAGTTILSGGGGFPGVSGTEVQFVASEAAGGGWYTEGRSIAGTHTLVVQAYCVRNP